MPDQSTQHLNSELPARAREHRERELLERIDVREREAMREFCLLYYHRLARFLCRLTPRHDLIDEVITRMFEARNKLRGLVPIPAAPRGEAQAYPRITWS